MLSSNMFDWPKEIVSASINKAANLVAIGNQPLVIGDIGKNYLALPCRDTTSFPYSVICGLEEGDVHKNSS